MLKYQINSKQDWMHHLYLQEIKSHDTQIHMWNVCLPLIMLPFLELVEAVHFSPEYWVSAGCTRMEG